MSQNDPQPFTSEAIQLLQDTLLPLWETSLFTPTKADASCLNYSLIQNVYLISKLFDTPEKINWLKENSEKFKNLIQDTLFDKSHFITENYEILERRLEECMSF